jgi:hypothetical protein
VARTLTAGAGGVLAGRLIRPETGACPIRGASPHQ